MDSGSGGDAQLCCETSGLDGRFRGVGDNDNMRDPRSSRPTYHFRPVTSELLVREVAVRIDEHGRPGAN